MAGFAKHLKAVFFGEQSFNHLRPTVFFWKKRADWRDMVNLYLLVTESFFALSADVGVAGNAGFLLASVSWPPAAGGRA